ncbi:hypothetical protein I4U23_001646 [Adineta vaga]|nr:hypothetical protein I4U23_001646 [Adineta vaga]
MSASYPAPPSYEEIDGTSTSKISSANWQAWYRKLISVEFKQDEATDYAKLFSANEVEVNMIPELNDGILKSIGIEKAGHRIRILRLKYKTSTSTSSSSPRASTVATAPVNIPRCAWHPQVAAIEKCRKCNRMVCLSCRREKSGDGGTRYYCDNCFNDCIIL